MAKYYLLNGSIPIVVTSGGALVPSGADREISGEDYDALLKQWNISLEIRRAEQLLLAAQERLSLSTQRQAIADKIVAGQQPLTPEELRLILPKF
jgi:hypothetical protein